MSVQAGRASQAQEEPDRPILTSGAPQQLLANWRGRTFQEIVAAQLTAKGHEPGGLEESMAKKALAEAMAQNGRFSAEKMQYSQTAAKLAPPVDPGRSNAFISKAVRAAKPRLAKERLFAAESDTSTDIAFGQIMSVVALSKNSYTFPLTEYALRIVLYDGGAITAEGTMQSVTGVEDRRPTDLETVFPDRSAEEIYDQLWAIGFAVAMTLINRTFVSAISDGAMRQLKVLYDEMNITAAVPSKEELLTLHNAYISRVDAITLLREFASAEFTGSPYIQAISRRYGSGTSHINAICTAMSMFAYGPFWERIPRYEFDAFGTALDKLDDDPLYLHPRNKVSPEESDKCRATAMPQLLSLSLLLCVEGGETTWAHYQNIPHCVTICGMSVPGLVAYIKRWVRVTKQAQFVTSVPAEIYSQEDITSDYNAIGLSKYVQRTNRATKMEGNALSNFYNRYTPGSVRPDNRAITMVELTQNKEADDQTERRLVRATAEPERQDPFIF